MFLKIFDDVGFLKPNIKLILNDTYYIHDDIHALKANTSMATLILFSQQQWSWF